jgi:hypothetical protein
VREVIAAIAFVFVVLMAAFAVADWLDVSKQGAVVVGVAAMVLINFVLDD